MTFLGGAGHTLPFLITNLRLALIVAYTVVAIELTIIAAIRHRFFGTRWIVSIMQVVGEPGAVPPVVAEMNAALGKHSAKPAAGLERNAFYAAAESAYAIVQTGERRFYGNILLTKGVVAPEEQT